MSEDLSGVHVICSNCHEDRVDCRIYRGSDGERHPVCADCVIGGHPVPCPRGSRPYGGAYDSDAMKKARGDVA